MQLDSGDDRCMTHTIAFSTWRRPCVSPLNFNLKFKFDTWMRVKGVDEEANLMRSSMERFYSRFGIYICLTAIC